MELKGKKALVVGLGGSGAASVRFLHAAGAVVTATDLKTESDLKEVIDRIADLDVRLELGGHPKKLFENSDLIVLSPGVPKDLPQLKAARKKGVEIVSELEMAARHVHAPMIAVTGTNGKSTVVALAGEIMKAALGEDRVFVGGNIGTPLTELPLSGRTVEAAVVEVSSFQLEFAPGFHPRVACMLNITADHLDRYRDFKEYAEYKWRIFDNQTGDDFAVLNADDPLVMDMAGKLATKIVTFGRSRPAGSGAWVWGDVIEYASPEGEVPVMPVADIPLHGGHNLMNVMAAACAALAMGAEFQAIREAVRTFKGLPHRLELVRELSGVKFYNDSKATNAGAVEAAVTGLDVPVVLLMGGQAKGCEFRELASKLSGRVRQIVAFGECRAQVKKQMNKAIPVTSVKTLEQALKSAAEKAGPGEAVLLAPGCASFDQFENYKERGRAFQRLVMELG